MRLFSYIVARDYGFAPNPFNAHCTLATCKPKIRSGATIGDWVVGTGAKTKYDLTGRLIYAMNVEEVLDFDSYWSDPRFFCKRPVLNGSLKQVYGDNIYHRHRGKWLQEDSHHSLDGGCPNPRNIARDTSVNRLLIARKFIYLGSASLPIPKRFRPYRPTAEDICCSGQGHRVMSHELATAFEKWLEDLGKWGMQGLPLEFERHARMTPSVGADGLGKRRAEMLGNRLPAQRAKGSGGRS